MKQTTVDYDLGNKHFENGNDNEIYNVWLSEQLNWFVNLGMLNEEFIYETISFCYK